MPPVKQTASFPYCFVTEIEMFRILDRLKPTVTWLDGLPAWFLRLGAPYLQPHWPTCSACPICSKWSSSATVEEGVHPAEASDCRPIFVTPVLSRLLERHIVKTCIYPALQQSPIGLHFADQFAFRPTGSTDAALITLLHKVFTMLTMHPMSVCLPLTSPKHSTRSDIQHLWRRWLVLLCQKSFKIGSITFSADIHVAPNLWTVFPTLRTFSLV